MRFKKPNIPVFHHSIFKLIELSYSLQPGPYYINIERVNKRNFSKGKRRPTVMRNENNVFYWMPCSVVFVSTVHGDQRDIMTATAMFVSEKEPLLVISVATGHLTEKLISQSGRFTLVIAADDQKQLAMQVGSFKGQAADKFELFKIKTTAGGGKALIPEGAAAWVECEVESTKEIKGYHLFMGRVVNQNDTGKAPLVWHKDKFFRLNPA
jgi:flavin reductase (DIM6/NTAB) family NADH-FMN oxidoreductase RutF